MKTTIPTPGAVAACAAFRLPYSGETPHPGIVKAGAALVQVDAGNRLAVRVELRGDTPVAVGPYTSFCEGAA